ncbi:MAG: PUA domain-containing protein, partial [Nanoarchaeota archaeon]
GTYIRTLIHQMGLYLKTGAHMTQLIRTKTGPFTYKTWHSLQDLKDAYEYYKQGDETELRKIIHPFEVALEKMPKIWVHDSAVNTLCHGSSLGVPGIAKVTANISPQETVAIMTLKEECICLGTATMSSKEMIEKEKGLAATTYTVFMERNTYPSPNKKI